MDGKYIYCVIQSNHQKNFGPIGIGGTGEELTTVNYKDISVVTSNCSVKEFTVSRENTMAHEKAIETVMKEHPVLPVRFSTIANSESEIIEKVLTPRYDEFKKLLSWISDKEEIGVRAKWMNMELVFKDILEKNDRIRELKEKLVNRKPEKAYYEKIELGKLVEDKLKEEKENERNKMLNVLKKGAVDCKDNDVYGEDMILSGSFLVKKEKESDFFSLVSKIQDGYGPKVKMKYVTGCPPFNFVNLVIKL